jgi:hypothetical protein
MRLINGGCSSLPGPTSKEAVSEETTSPDLALANPLALNYLKLTAVG